VFQRSYTDEYLVRSEVICIYIYRMFQISYTDEYLVRSEVICIYIENVPEKLH